MVVKGLSNVEIAGRLGVAAGRIGQFGIRPEAIRLTGEATALRARIDTIQPTGADWIVGIVVEGRQLFALSAEAPPSGSGAEVGVHLKTQGLHAFDPDGKVLEHVA